MNIEMQPGVHYIAAHVNGHSEPIVSEYSGEGGAVKAQQAFWGYVQATHCNWVKFWTIRELDGLYLFNGEFQKRTPRR